MGKFDNFNLNLNPDTLLKNGCQQNLFIMTNFASLVYIKKEIAGFKVCHFNLELSLNLNSVTGFARTF